MANFYKPHPRCFKQLIMKSLFVYFLIPLLAVCCNPARSGSGAELEFIRVVGTEIPDLSGIALSPMGSSFFVVSDSKSKVYEIAANGIIIRESEGLNADLEGITFDQDGNILVVDEVNYKVIKLDASLEVIDSFSIDYDNGIPNSGLEGISCDVSTGTCYLLNEKQPGELFVCNSRFEIEKKIRLDFAKDFSGVFYDPVCECLWITSDENKKLFQCSTEGKVMDELPLDVAKAEGAVVNSKTGAVHVVCDRTGKLYTYTMVM